MIAAGIERIENRQRLPDSWGVNREWKIISTYLFVNFRNWFRPGMGRGLFLSPRWEKYDRQTWSSHATVVLSEIMSLAGFALTGGQRSTSAKELRDRHHVWELNIIGDAWREKETIGDVGGTITCSHGKSTRLTNSTWYSHAGSHAGPKVRYGWIMVYYEWNIISYYCLSYIKHYIRTEGISVCWSKIHKRNDNPVD